MLRFIVFITGLICISNFAVSQNNNAFPVVSHLTKDSAFIKWIPKDIQMFNVVLENGARVTISAENNRNDFENGFKIDLEPVVKKWEKWDLSNEKLDRIHEIQFGIQSALAHDKTAQDYAFTIASLEASLSFEMNLLSDLMIAIPRPKSTGSFAVKVEIKGYEPVIQIIENKTSKIGEVPKLIGKVDRKKIATISWNADSVVTEYLGFQIERKIDNGKFEKILTSPFVNFKTNAEKPDRLASYRDEKLEQGKTYTYKIYGINYFGFKGKYSNEVKIYLPKLVNATVNIDTVESKGYEREISVSLMKEIDSLPLLVNRLVLMRSDSLLINYNVVEQRMIKPNETKILFKTTSLLPSGDRNYFKVFAFSPDNDTAYSTPYYYFTLDQEPPKAVSNLKGLIDSLGHVTLSWTKPKDNDLQGYRVYRANLKTEEFVEKTTSLKLETIYLDTLNLNTLNNDIYYFVVSVDQNYNNSPNSDTILVIKPDTIPPSEPFIISLRKVDVKIDMEWQNSTSKDVEKSYLLRKTDLQTDTILSWKKDEYSHFIDSTFAFSKDINYSILSVDQSKNQTSSKSRSLFIEPGFRPALQQVKAVADRSNKNIVISWLKPQTEVFQYFIYRKKGDGNFHLIETISNASLSNCNFQDKTVSISNDYEYLIQYQSQDGFRSLKHEPVKVRY
ncbi:fibronectin type III domain-containing protein [Fluviicola taffensis]|nr:fibronectin type III domain-containing protein [Fluviicola taffensis]